VTSFESASEHEKFHELCALATAGVLTAAESASLNLHLRECSQCREALGQYRQIANEGIPSLAADFASTQWADEFDEFSAFERLMRSTAMVKPQPARLAVVPRQKQVWNQSWVRGLAAAFVFVAVAMGAYRVGAHSASTHTQAASTAIQPAFDGAAEEKRQLERTVQAESQKILALERQAATDQSDLAKFRAQANDSADRASALAGDLSAVKRDAAEQLAALAQERDASANKLHDAEKMYQNVQDELNTLRSQHQQDLLRSASLETSVNSLNAELIEQSKREKADGQFLAIDKDVRDLIGARNLYIADIMDVNETGQSKKPFGRVFYTKTKSLIFYAYDLDNQPGVKRASTFQVWGRTSASDRKPINLGILYLDSETNQRWTLRVDNPERLANLDAVFVTVEPHEQTDKPTGKPFLYASLRREANHP
jgi:hypothetical protein